MKTFIQWLKENCAEEFGNIVTREKNIIKPYKGKIKSTKILEPVKK